MDSGTNGPRKQESLSKDQPYSDLFGNSGIATLECTTDADFSGTLIAHFCAHKPLAHTLSLFFTNGASQKINQMQRTLPEDLA